MKNVLLADYTLLHKIGNESLEVLLDSFAEDDEVLVQSAFMVSGREYRSLKKRLATWKKKNVGRKIEVTKPVLCGRKKINLFAKLLYREALEALSGKRIVLLGHGKKHSLNCEYFALEKKLKAFGADLVMVLEKGRTHRLALHAPCEKKICLVPLFVTGAHHTKEFILSSEKNGIVFDEILSPLGTQEWFRKFLEENK